MQRFNYQGRWYTLEQYQKLLNPTATPEAVEVPNLSEQPSSTAIEQIVPEVEAKPLKKAKKSNKK